MKIKNIEAVALNMPLKQLSKGGTYRIERRGTIVTRIETDENVSGFTYLGQLPTEVEMQKKICKIINENLKKELIDNDPFMILKLWTKMYSLVKTSPNYRHNDLDRDLMIQAISCIDVCLYDVVGKALGIPVYKLIGGYRKDVPLILVQYYEKAENFSEQIEELHETAKNAKREGYAGIKLKVGAMEIKQDIERVKTVREEGGEDFVIACDANHAWTTEKSIRFGKEAEKYSIAYLEEPVPVYNEKRDLKIVKEKINVPIGACQNFSTGIEIMDYVVSGSVNMINPDIILVGGITAWKWLANNADYYNVKMTANACIEATLQLFGGTPNATWATQQAAWRDPFWSGGELIESIPKPVKGFVSLSDQPGMGYKIKEEAITKLRINKNN